MLNAIEIEVNGKRYPVHYDPQTPLLYVLRDELGLTGSKYGCGGRRISVRLLHTRHDHEQRWPLAK